MNPKRKKYLVNFLLFIICLILISICTTLFNLYLFHDKSDLKCIKAKIIKFEIVNQYKRDKTKTNIHYAYSINSDKYVSKNTTYLLGSEYIQNDVFKTLQQSFQKNKSIDIFINKFYPSKAVIFLSLNENEKNRIIYEVFFLISLIATICFFKNYLKVFEIVNGVFGIISIVLTLILCINIYSFHFKKLIIPIVLLLTLACMQYLIKQRIKIKDV